MPSCEVVVRRPRPTVRQIDAGGAAGTRPVQEGRQEGGQGQSQSRKKGRRTAAAPKKAAPAKPAPAPAAEEEDDDDFWGEDEEQTEEEKAAAASRSSRRPRPKRWPSSRRRKRTSGRYLCINQIVATRPPRDASSMAWQCGSSTTRFSHGGRVLAENDLVKNYRAPDLKIFTHRSLCNLEIKPWEADQD